MARTRNASAAFEVQLDRQGNPISPAAAYLQRPQRLSGSTVLPGPGAEPVPPQPPVVGYRADPETWSRNMEAYELALLLDLALRGKGNLGKGLVVEVSEAEFAALPGDVRRHFMPVRRGA